MSTPLTFREVSDLKDLLHEAAYGGRSLDELERQVRGVIDKVMLRTAGRHGACVCDTGPGTDGPDEFCPQHGRPYRDLLEILDEEHRARRMAERAHEEVGGELSIDEIEAVGEAVAGALSSFVLKEDPRGPMGAVYAAVACIVRNRESAARVAGMKDAAADAALLVENLRDNLDANEFGARDRANWGEAEGYACAIRLVEHHLGGIIGAART